MGKVMHVPWECTRLFVACHVFSNEFYVEVLAQKLENMGGSIVSSTGILACRGLGRKEHQQRHSEHRAVALHYGAHE